MATGVKIGDDLARAARAEAVRARRSMTEQLEYWARIGRALERAPGVSVARIRRALDAACEFDALNADERAVALAGLEALSFRPKGDAALQHELASRGQSYTVLNDAGQVVELRPGRRRRVIADVDAYAEPPDSAA